MTLKCAYRHVLRITLLVFGILLSHPLPAANIDPGTLSGANGGGPLLVFLFEDGTALVKFGDVVSLVLCFKDVNGFPTCRLGNDANGKPILVVAGDVTFNEHKPGSTTLSEILRFPEDRPPLNDGTHVTNLVQLLSAQFDNSEPPEDQNEKAEYNDVDLTHYQRLNYEGSSQPGPLPEGETGLIEYIPTQALPAEDAVYLIISDAPEPESAGLFAAGMILIAFMIRWRRRHTFPITG